MESKQRTSIQQPSANIPFVSLIIPAYNEEGRIGKTLHTVLQYLEQQPYEWEVLVVDDGSTDQTAAVVAQFPAVELLQLPENRGKGAAVKEGMLHARGAVRVFSDADLSTPITELPKLLECIQSGCDVCIGSRALRPELVRRHQPWYRETMGKIFNVIVQLLVMRGIKDTQCGFKAFRAEVVETVFPQLQTMGFAFDVEVLLLARQAGYSICEIPVLWYNDERSRVHPIRDATKMLIELLRIRFRHWRRSRN